MNFRPLRDEGFFLLNKFKLQRRDDNGKVRLKSNQRDVFKFF